MLNHQYSLPVNTDYVLEQGMAVAAPFERLSHANCHSDCLWILLHSIRKKSILSAETMVNMLEIKKLVQGCFPSFIVTVLWMNLDKVSRDAHTPSLFSTFIRCAVPPWLSIRSVISVCIGSEQRSSVQYIIAHSRKEMSDLLYVICTWRWVVRLLDACTPSPWYRSCQHTNGFPYFRIDLIN